MISLITGGGGFIGSHLKTKLLELGHEVRDCDEKTGERLETIIITNSGEWKTDFVVHLAATADVRRSFREPELYWQNNVENTLRIQQLCTGHNIPLIYASSSCAKKWWLSPYGTTKRVNEETSRSNQVGLRFTTVYGDGASEGMFMSRLKSGNIEYVTKHTRDFIHVSDVVDVIIRLMSDMTKPNHPMTGAYDVGTGRGNKVNKLAELAGYDLPVKDGEPCEAPENIANIKPIQTLLSDLKGKSWEPTVKVREYIKNGYRVKGL